MQLGGPVWHVSVSCAPQYGASTDTLLRECYVALEGAGDASLGEWTERGDKAVHVRRRLSDLERASHKRLSAVDIRGTFEARERTAKMQQHVPSFYRGRVF